MNQKVSFLCFIVVTLMLQGCLLSQLASRSEISKGWIGNPFSELMGAKGRKLVSEKSYKLKTGNDVYAVDECTAEQHEYPKYIGKCIIYWEVNSEGIIVDSQLEEEI